MSDIVNRLRGLADVFEAQQAPHNLVLHMRAGAAEIERLRAGGCARDQGVTQYCAEAARLAAENERLRDALEPILKYPGIRDKIGSILHEAGCAALEALKEKMNG